eukprot:439778-Amphidinium_carterae.1
MATSAHSLVSVVLLVTDDANDPDNVLTDDSVEVLTLVRVCDMLDELEVTETAVDEEDEDDNERKLEKVLPKVLVVLVVCVEINDDDDVLEELALLDLLAELLVGCEGNVRRLDAGALTVLVRDVLDNVSVNALDALVLEEGRLDVLVAEVLEELVVVHGLKVLMLKDDALDVLLELTLVCVEILAMLEELVEELRLVHELIELRPGVDMLVGELLIEPELNVDVLDEEEEALDVLVVELLEELTV